MDAFLSAAPPRESGRLSPLYFSERFRRLPELETPRLRLRKVRRGDAADLFAYAKDPEVSRHVLWTAHQSLSDSRAFLQELRRQYRRGCPATFGIEEKESGRLIGTIGFMWVNPEHRWAEIGYSLARSRWNRGLMTEALGEVLRFSFEELGLHRVEAVHETDNPASGRVMEKAGMKPEGTLRQRVYNKGHFSDVRMWAILREDWLRMKEEHDVHV